MNVLAALKGYRTVLFNLIMTAAMVASMNGWIGPEAGPTEAGVNQFLDSLDAVLAGVMGVGNILLRFATTTPIGQKE